MRYYLVGMPGAGKSYIGRELSRLKSLPFLDLDQMIESDAGMSVSEIFALEGEDSFRRLEEKILRKTLGFPDAVIATGGGTPCFFGNMNWMNNHGTTIWLSAPVEVLAERLFPQRHLRPLLQKFSSEDDLRQALRQLLLNREPYYRQAHHIIQSEKLLVTEELEQLVQ